LDIQHELGYLEELTKAHGRYLKQYFGFSLKEIALRVGLSPKMFLMILHKQKKMPEKYQQKFIEVFRGMDIENRTKDFKPTESQKARRAFWMKINLDKLRNFVILLIMVTFLECIVRFSDDSKRLVNFCKARFEFYSSLVFSLVKENLEKSFIKLNSQSWAFLFL
jgi:predicted DNA-binding protein YlxM (UPF0122 family)